MWTAGVWIRGVEAVHAGVWIHVVEAVHAGVWIRGCGLQVCGFVLLRP